MGDFVIHRLIRIICYIVAFALRAVRYPGFSQFQYSMRRCHEDLGSSPAAARGDGWEKDHSQLDISAVSLAVLLRERFDVD
jgi:hypothetical protein